MKFEDFLQSEFDKKVQKNIEDMSRILTENHKQPGIILERLCKQHGMNLDEVINEYLDYYNIIFRQIYRRNGEDATLPMMQEWRSKEALYHALRYIEKNRKLRIRRKLE